MALVLTASLLLPIQAHSVTELEQWESDWSQRADFALTPELHRERMDMHDRHLWFFYPDPEPRVSARAVARTQAAEPAPWPGDWVALVSTYFRPEDVNAALKVIACESGFSLTADNPRSTAWGPWQFLRSTWDQMVAPNTGSPSYDSGAPTDPVWSTINASWLWYHVGPSQWVCYR